METKHTPGPWKWWTSNSWNRLKRDDRDITQNVLEPFVARDGHPDCSVSEADMALIAAAPTMAEALEQCAAGFDVQTGDVVSMAASLAQEMVRRQEIAEAALRAARGEQGVG